jgi:hypothetical protein
MNYPTKYKFTSLDIYIKDTFTVTARETYGLLDIFGDIGGVLTFFTLPLGFILKCFPNMKILSILASFAYSNDPDKDSPTNQKIAPTNN